MYKAGYEYLLAFKLTVPLYDYTAEFCERWIGKYSRTKDQMEQAARSGSHPSSRAKLTTGQETLPRAVNSKD